MALDCSNPKMKFSQGEFEITKQYDERLRERAGMFRSATKTRKVTLKFCLAQKNHTPSAKFHYAKAKSFFAKANFIFVKAKRYYT